MLLMAYGPLFAQVESCCFTVYESLKTRQIKNGIGRKFNPYTYILFTRNSANLAAPRLIFRYLSCPMGPKVKDKEWAFTGQ